MPGRLADVLKRLSVVLLTVAVGCLTLIAITPGAQAAPAQSKYVALGDSFSAGVGTRDKQNDCYRSLAGYPGLLAQQYGLALNYQACSGAVTADVAANQLGALSADTAFVTMTIGGNDVGFAKVLTECAKPGWMSDCEGAIAEGRAIMANQLPGRYDALFADIRARAANARVTVAGYPRLFNGEDCNPATFFSESEQAALNSATDDLDALIADKAGAHRLGYADPRGTFEARAVCDNPEWINGLSLPIEESYHPNRAGNAGYAALLGPALTGRAADPSVMQQAESEQLAEQPSREVQLREQAQLVLDLDLTSSANLARAEQRGISADEVREAAGQLSSDDIETVSAGLDALQELDKRTA